MTIDIPARTIIKTVAILLAVVLLFVLRDVLIILFFAITIASAVGPFADWFERHRIPRLLSVLALYLVLGALGILLISIGIPILSGELSQLANNLPVFVEGIQSVLETIQESQYFGFVENLEVFLDSASRSLQISSISIASFAANIFGGMFSLTIVLVLSFYLSVIRRGIPSFLKSVLPDAYEGYAIGLWKRAEIKMGRWVQSQLLLALVVGLLVFIGLSLLNVKYALLLGILAMILEIVPIVGPVLFAIPGIILGFSQSPTIGVGVIIFYILVQQLEAHVLTPLVLGKSLDLHPVTVVVALLIGGKLAGILGVLLAVPMAVVIVELWDDMAAQRHNKSIST